MKLRPPRVKLAQSYADRLIGVGRGVTWREFDALCLPRCRAVHTLGLARPIDVVFVCDDAVIVEIRPRVPPWRIVMARASDATHAWEFPAGSCQACRASCGLSIEAMLSRMTQSANA